MPRGARTRRLGERGQGALGEQGQGALGSEDRVPRGARTGSLGDQGQGVEGGRGVHKVGGGWEGMAGQCRENNDQDPYPDSYGLTSVS